MNAGGDIAVFIKFELSMRIGSGHKVLRLITIQNQLNTSLIERTSMDPNSAHTHN